MAEGFVERAPNPPDLMRRRRVVLLAHQATGVPLDSSIGSLPFEQELTDRSTVQAAHGLAIRVPTPEDLIILKTVATRGKDIVDIASIIDMNPDINRQRIRDWVQGFAAILERPELWDDIARIVDAPPR